MALDILGPNDLFCGKFKKPFYIQEEDDFEIPRGILSRSFAKVIGKPGERTEPNVQRAPRQSSATFFDDVDGLIPLKSCLYVPKGDSGEKVPIKKSKSVHFADSCGLALTSVLPFVDGDEELGSGGFLVTTRKSYPVFETLKGLTTGERQQKNRLVNFSQPITRPDFNDLVSLNNVSLENITFREFSIFGTVRVKNISFEKRVFVKYTTDAWNSNATVIASYLPGSSTGTTDSFSFELLAKEEDGEGDVKFEFCVCFETLGEQFWDNNFGDNYRLVCHRKSRPLSESHALAGKKFALSQTDCKLIGWAA